MKKIYFAGFGSGVLFACFAMYFLFEILMIGASFESRCPQKMRREEVRKDLRQCFDTIVCAWPKF